jgi:hypothetical protein
MDLGEIERYIHASVAHSITVDVCDWTPAPGYVRTVTLHRNNRVTIEFQRAHEYLNRDWEGSGLRYVGQYADLDALVHYLQEFFGRPVGEWRNYTAQPFTPGVLDELDPASNMAYFENAVRCRLMRLPGGGAFTPAGVYWRHIQEYGVFRPDKLAEDTERLLRSRGVDPHELDDDE